MKYILDIFINDKADTSRVPVVNLINQLNMDGLIKNNSFVSRCVKNKWCRIEVDGEFFKQRYLYIDTNRALKGIDVLVGKVKEHGIECYFYSEIDKRDDNFKELFKK